MKRTRFFLLFMLCMLCQSFQTSFAQENGAVNHFYVQGGTLYDRCGEKVILRGVNKMSIWDENDPNGNSYFPEIRKTGANCVRMAWTTEGSPAHLDRLIQNCINNKMIPIVELHDATGDWSRLPLLAQYWKRPDVVQVLLRHSPYIIINIGNEVGDHSITPQQFMDGYRPIINQFRQSGISVPLMIDAPGFGKELDVLNATASQLLNGDPAHNLLFSAHLYYPKHGGATSVFIKSKLQEAAAFGYPLVIGEFSKYGAWMDGVDTQCGAQNEVEYQAILEACQQLELGWMAWSWGPGNAFGGDPLCTAMDMTTDGTFAGLQDGWAKEVALSSPYSIRNTAVTPASILNGSCPNAPGAPSAGTFEPDRATARLGSIRSQNQGILNARADQLGWGLPNSYVQDGSLIVGALYNAGAIFMDPASTKTYIIYGAIFDKWKALGGYSVVGKAINDESGCPDGRGRYNHFQHSNGSTSSIYWTPQTGAQHIYGAIRDAWAQQGWERGALGYPTTSEMKADYPEFDRMNRFEKGRIYWSSLTGIKVIPDRRID